MLWRRRIRSRRIREQRRERILLSSLVWLAVFLALGLFSVQLSLLPKLRVERIYISGNEATSDRDIYSEISEGFAGRYFFLFPRSNILLFSRVGMEIRLLEKFPRIKYADVSAVSLHDVQISVVERHMVGVVCHSAGESGAEEVVEESAREVCLFVDDGGFIFASAPTFSGNAFFRFYDTNREKLLKGTHFLSETEFTQLLQLKDAFLQLGLNPVSLTLGGEGDVDFTRHFTFGLAEGTEIIFGAEEDELEAQLQNLQAILVSEAFAEESGGDIGTIEYIDLRFGNKVFYRLGESPAE